LRSKVLQPTMRAMVPAGSLDQDLTGFTLDGRYHLTRRMGAGGMGQVYAGVQKSLDRKVAVKLLLPRFAAEPRFRERFLREAKAASKVHHPNVVQILDFGETSNGWAYFVMELLEGQDLQALIRAEGRLPWSRAQPLLLQITAALGAAHDLKIVHRDIKPANCFVIETEDHRELVKLLDFGLAKITAEPGEESDSLTATGEVFGTAKYMAPEQAVGSSKDPRVDVYSVGVMAYEMLTGRAPFTGPTAFHVITKHINEPPKPPRRLNWEIPREVEAIILQALAKQPADRFGSIHEMRHALAAVTAQTGVEPTCDPPPEPSASGFASSATPVSPPRSGAPTSGPESDRGGTEPQYLPNAIVTVPQMQPGWDRRREPVAGSRRRRRAAGIIIGALSAAGLSIVLMMMSMEARDDPAPRTSDAPRVASSLAEPEPSSTIPSTVHERSDPHEDLSPPTNGNDPAAPTEAPPEAPPEASSTSAADSPTAASDVPNPASSKLKRAKPSRPKKPPTDDDVRTTLSRTIQKRCRSLGEGAQVMVDLLVGDDGNLSNKLVRGASGELKRCVLDEVAKARFAAGPMRKLAVEVSL